MESSLGGSMALFVEEPEPDPSAEQPWRISIPSSVRQETPSSTTEEPMVLWTLYEEPENPEDEPWTISIPVRVPSEQAHSTAPSELPPRDDVVDSDDIWNPRTLRVFADHIERLAREDPETSYNEHPAVGSREDSRPGGRDRASRAVR
jgi:hypothetical protein